MQNYIRFTFYTTVNGCKYLWLVREYDVCDWTVQTARRSFLRLLRKDYPVQYQDPSKVIEHEHRRHEPDPYFG